MKAKRDQKQKKFVTLKSKMVLKKSRGVFLH